MPFGLCQICLQMFYLIQKRYIKNISRLRFVNNLVFVPPYKFSQNNTAVFVIIQSIQYSLMHLRLLQDQNHAMKDVLLKYHWDKLLEFR